MVRRPLLFAFCSLLAGQTARDLRIERVGTTLPDKSTRWALVVGVSKYKYAPESAQLKFAHRDAEEFAGFLRTPMGGGFASAQVRVLTEEKATLAAVRAAIHHWLPKATSPNDVVYVFFAGHAVVGERQQPFFVAHDSDPQNLSATALPFSELNDALTRKIRSSLVVLFADACHAGGIGWTSDPKSYSRAHGSIDALGSQDRAILKLLASRPSEKSFEDERWGGGHGVFTYTLLNGLKGAADRENDGVIRAAELIEYVSRAVPQQTSSLQTPRVAGNFEGGLPMAVVHTAAPPAGTASSLRLKGRPGTAVYVDAKYQGSIRPAGDLVVDRLAAGSHTMSFDVPGLGSVDQRLTLRPGESHIDVDNLTGVVTLRAEALVRAGRVLGAGGVVEMYGSVPEDQREALEPVVTAGLEQTGQECVSDYVQSTTNALKRPMFLRSAEAFERLQGFRPNDKTIAAKALFCRGRAEIAGGDFAAALVTLRKSLELYPDFACSYNALGVTHTRLNLHTEARKAFEKAKELAPEWALPSLEIARQYIAAADLKGAVPHLEEAARMHPVSTGVRWSLARLYRVLGRGPEFEREAEAVAKLDPNYAPIYSELGLYHESARNFAQAARYFDTYLLLAPNYADSADLRTRAQKSRAAVAPKQAPTLRRTP